MYNFHMKCSLQKTLCVSNESWSQANCHMKSTTFVRPLSVIRARQRLALARALAKHGEPDYDIVLCVCERQREIPDARTALHLLSYWQSRR